MGRMNYFHGADDCICVDGYTDAGFSDGELRWPLPLPYYIVLEEKDFSAC